MLIMLLHVTPTVPEAIPENIPTQVMSEVCAQGQAGQATSAKPVKVILKQIVILE